MTAFRNRLSKLEARRSLKGVCFPAVVFGEMGRADAQVIGAISNGISVTRISGESVAALIARSGAKLRAKILFLTYVAGHPGDTVVISPAKQVLS